MNKEKNKLYFAKYLPVKNQKVKDGDMVLNLDEFTSELVGPDGTLDLDTVLDEPDVFPKLELFICSKDIQKGDSYLTAPDYSKPRICEDTSYDFENCLKVIGKVSKDAIWVKEGDEFNHEELLQQGTGVNLTVNGGVVTVLCSNCKTFH